MLNIFCKFYCKNLNIKVVLTLHKDPLLESLKSFVNKVFAPGYNACYIGETTRHLSEKIKQQLKTDKKSLIF